MEAAILTFDDVNSYVIKIQDGDLYGFFIIISFKYVYFFFLKMIQLILELVKYFYSSV